MGHDDRAIEGTLEFNLSTMRCIVWFTSSTVELLTQMVRNSFVNGTGDWNVLFSGHRDMQTEVFLYDIDGLREMK